MDGIKMEPVTTTTTENQNPPAILENQIVAYQNPPAILENHQSNYAAASSSSRVIQLADSRINAYLQSFPPGFRFKPTDEELILDYLLKKINKEGLHPSRIHDTDIYKESPSYLSENHVAANENEWYFLSPRVKKYANGVRPDRAAGNGYWKATGADKSITSKNKGEVGVVKTLVYYEGNPKNSIKTSWIMKEYRVKKSPNSTSSNNSERTMTLDDYVLYKIYEHKKNKSDATSIEAGEADDQNPPFENFHDGVPPQQLNINQDHGQDGSFVNGDHINQQNHVDNIREMDYSAGQQQQQQQQMWPFPNPNYSGYYTHVFPNDMSMPIRQMHGNVFYPQNSDLMLHETLYSQQTVSDHDAVYDCIPHEFPRAILPGADAFNNVQAFTNDSNTSEGFSQAIPPVADASNDVQAFNNEMNIPQMQQQWFQYRPAMTRPSSSSGYHPYHRSNHPQK